MKRTQTSPHQLPCIRVTPWYIVSSIGGQSNMVQSEDEDDRGQSLHQNIPLGHEHPSTHPNKTPCVHCQKCEIKYFPAMKHGVCRECQHLKMKCSLTVLPAISQAVSCTFSHTSHTSINHQKWGLSQNRLTCQ